MNINSNKRVLLKRSLKNNLSLKLIVTSLLYKFTKNDAACCELNTEYWEMFLTNACLSNVDCLSPDRGHCFVFLSKITYSYRVSLHPGV